MLDFLGFIATAALMVLAVNAVITFMDVSPSAKLTLATLAGLWIGVAAAAGSAGMIQSRNPSLSSDYLWQYHLLPQQSRRHGLARARLC
jgi:hypothetical protein